MNNPKAEYQKCCDLWDRLEVLSDARPSYVEWLEQEYSRHEQSIDGWRARWRRKTELVHAYRKFIVQHLEPMRRLAMDISLRYEPCGYYCDESIGHVDHKLFNWAKYLYGDGVEHYIPEPDLLDKRIQEARKVKP